MLKKSFTSILILSSLLLGISKDKIIDKINYNNVFNMEQNKTYGFVNPFNDKDTLFMKTFDWNEIKYKYGENVFGTAKGDTIEIAHVAPITFRLHELGHKALAKNEDKSKVPKIKYENKDFAETYNIFRDLHFENKDLQNKLDNITSYLSSAIAIEEAKAISFEYSILEKENNKTILNKKLGYYLLSEFAYHRQGELIALFLESKLGSFKDANFFIRSGSNEDIKSFLINLSFIEEQNEFNKHLFEKYGYDLESKYELIFRSYFKHQHKEAYVSYLNDYVNRFFIKTENIINPYSKQNMLEDFQYIKSNYSYEINQQIHSLESTTKEK